MAVELAYIGIALRFFQVALIYDSSLGLVAGISILTLAACEGAVFLAIITRLHSHDASVAVNRNAAPEK